MDIDIIPNIDNLDELDQADLQDLEELRQTAQNSILRLNFYMLLRRLRRTRSKRRFFSRRRFYDNQFYQAFGFTPTECETLLIRIGHRFQRRTKTNYALRTPEILMMSLRYLRTGGNFWNSGFFIGPSRQSANASFWEFIEAVNAELNDLITLAGTEEEWMHHATVFYEQHRISNVVGAIDGSYIHIRNIGDATVWFCRKGFAAINLTMMVDSSKQIRFISCRWPGSLHDSNVYRNTGLAQMVRDGWEPFPGAVILGDSAYQGVDRFVLPHPRENQIRPYQRNFYQANKNARNIVERVYGELKGKFGILSRRTGPMNLSIVTCIFH
uniref:DDE Tnp4 domain-containing protein n=1 Tax=Panagrolaimus sp. PS1159 TaxID=55785 RepID=A0AC35G7I9_9BILA